MAACEAHDERNGVSRILMVSSAPPEWHELARITGESKARYCRRWGYDYYANLCSPIDKDTGYPVKNFIKFDLIWHGLTQSAESYEWVMWADADALITNSDIRIEDVLLSERHDCKNPACGGLHEHDVVVGYDHNSHHTTVFFVRNTPQAQRYIWACNNTGRRLFITHPWSEMEAMRYFCQLPPYHNLLGWLPIKKLCGIKLSEYEKFGLPAWMAQPYGWEPGDWILHLSALSYERRTQLATWYSNPANHHLTPPKELTPEQINWLNQKRAEIGDEALKPIVAEMEGRT